MSRINLLADQVIRLVSGGNEAVASRFAKSEVRLLVGQALAAGGLTATIQSRQSDEGAVSPLTPISSMVKSYLLPVTTDAIGSLITLPETTGWLPRSRNLISVWPVVKEEGKKIFGREAAIEQNSADARQGETALGGHMKGWKVWLESGIIRLLDPKDKQATSAMVSLYVPSEGEAGLELAAISSVMGILQARYPDLTPDQAPNTRP